jgi:hypothetical protein
VIEADDRLQTWKTADFHNGWYRIYMRAYDRAGNATLDSMDVNVANYFSLSGRVVPADGDLDSANAIVTVISQGTADTTNPSGAFQLALVGGGTQEITVARRGYETVDTLLVFNQDHQLELTLTPNFLAGDANCDGLINIGDAVHLANFVFRYSPGPIPYFAGDANHDATVNVGDVVYLVNYIFHEGPPPLASL